METSQGAVDSNQIRDQMLRLLYKLHGIARSMDRQQVGIRELQQRMKAEFGLSQHQVAANLDYLMEQGFVRRIMTPRSFTTKAGTTQSSERITYKISKNGIDRLEGDSMFKSVSPFAGINITAINGLVAVGNNNQQRLVLRQFEPLAAQLAELARSIRQAPLTDDAKLSFGSDRDDQRSIGDARSQPDDHQPCLASHRTRGHRRKGSRVGVEGQRGLIAFVRPEVTLN
jgi:hypothetical protein